MEVWIYTILSVLIVSIVSLIGIFTIGLKEKKIHSFAIILVSLAAGTLLGDAFIHLIPEAFEHNKNTTSMYILTGILLFFVVEKFIHWRHCHNDIDCQVHKKHLVPMNIIGDSIHNLIDGMLIAASFSASITTGIATTIAVVLHEIPQEIGDFGILVYSGIKIPKALFINFLTALTALLGAAITLLIGTKFITFTQNLIPIAAGGFIYIAGTDLIPELHHEIGLKKALKQLSLLALGILIMYTLKFLEI